VIEEKEGYIYGIYWTRDEPIFPIHGDEVTWYSTYAEARREYDERDDKYWPSVFMETVSSDCPNCDGRKCMGCIFREYDHDCADDCPVCRREGEL